MACSVTGARNYAKGRGGRSETGVNSQECNGRGGSQKVYINATSGHRSVPRKWLQGLV